MVDNVTAQAAGEEDGRRRLVAAHLREVRAILQAGRGVQEGPNGEPLYPRAWNAAVLDLPVVVYSKQKRPALKVEGINALIATAESDEERYLYVLLAATGMRIS